jgi:hypothetical protein
MLLYPQFQSHLHEALTAISGKGTQERVDFIQVKNGGALEGKSVNH